MEVDLKEDTEHTSTLFKNAPELKNEPESVQVNEHNVKHDQPHLELEQVSPVIQESFVFHFKQDQNDYSTDFSGIDPDLVNSGERFSGDFDELNNLSIGDTVTIEVAGLKVNGTVSKKKDSNNVAGASYSKIKFENQGEYMTAYFNEGSTKGKIYTNDGSYIYEHNGNAGFLISIFEFKKINDALVID